MLGGIELHAGIQVSPPSSSRNGEIACKAFWCQHGLSIMLRTICKWYKLPADPIFYGDLCGKGFISDTFVRSVLGLANFLVDLTETRTYASCTSLITAAIGGPLITVECMLVELLRWQGLPRNRDIAKRKDVLRGTFHRRCQGRGKSGCSCAKDYEQRDKSRSRRSESADLVLGWIRYGSCEARK